MLKTTTPSADRYLDSRKIEKIPLEYSYLGFKKSACFIILLLPRSPLFSYSIFTPVGLGVGLG